MTVFTVYSGIGRELDYDAAREYIRDGYLLSPKTVLKGLTKLPQSIDPPISVDLNKIPFYAQHTLESALGNLAGTRRAVMFSGGFDSILIAFLAQRCGAQVTAVTIQFDDFNRLTVEGAADCACKVGITHHVLTVKAVEFLAAFEALAGITDEPVLDLDLAIVYAALKNYDRQIAGNIFISGMGSDQWFGNEALEARPGGLAARLDWAIVDEDAHHRAAQVHGHKFIFPFLSEPMLTLSQSIPDSMKKDKQLLRALAVANTIPHRGARSEIQVPDLMRRILVRTFGDRAWPGPVAIDSAVDDQTLRKIVLGLWLEKAKGRIAGL